MLTIMLAAATAVASAPADYSMDANWLCRPGRRDACSTKSLDATQVDADGKLTKIPFTFANKKQKVDCFYVYPTLSNDPGGNSDLVPNDEERFVVKAQFARFASVCKTYAPMYRQITLTALRTAMAGGPNPGDFQLAYKDVRASFKYYLASTNKGRPFVLVGHSQGSRMLTQLVKDEIDGKPVQKQLLSAMLIGSNVLVPVGKDVGGDFKSVPLCRTDNQTGCAISYVSFRAESPPPANSRFARSAEAGMAVACTNPAKLSGGKAIADGWLGAAGSGASGAPANPWAKGATITTAFVRTPGLFSSECVSSGGSNYLAITINADPSDARTDSITGDVMAGSMILKDWGLHLLDVSLLQGDLLRLVKSQGAAHSKKKS